MRKRAVAFIALDIRTDALCKVVFNQSPPDRIVKKVAEVHRKLTRTDLHLLLGDRRVKYSTFDLAR